MNFEEQFKIVDEKKDSSISEISPLIVYIHKVMNEYSYDELNRIISKLHENSSVQIMIVVFRSMFFCKNNLKEYKPKIEQCSNWLEERGIDSQRHFSGLL